MAAFIDSHIVKVNRLCTILFFFSALFSGCAKTVQYQIGSPDLAKSNEIRLIDRRPDLEKKAETMSINKNSCWFGIYRIGDDQVTPQKLDLVISILQSNLKGKMNGKMIGKELIVNRFDVYNNIQLGMKRVVSMVSLGMTSPVPGADEIRLGGCTDAFALDVNPENSPSVLVNYDIAIDGVRISGKVVQLEPYNINDDNVRSPTVRERIRKGIERAAEEISNKYSG